MQGLLKTAEGNSPSVSTVEVVISLASFITLYITLGVVWAMLMLRSARCELPPDEFSSELRDEDVTGPRPPALTY